MAVIEGIERVPHVHVQELYSYRFDLPRTNHGKMMSKLQEIQSRGSKVMVEILYNNIGYRGVVGLNELKELQSALNRAVTKGIKSSTIRNSMELKAGGMYHELLGVLNELAEGEIGTPNTNQTESKKKESTHGIEIELVIEGVISDGTRETINLPYKGPGSVDDEVRAIESSLGWGMGVEIVSHKNNLGYGGGIPFDAIPYLSRQIDKLQATPNAYNMVKASLYEVNEANYREFANALYKVDRPGTVFLKDAATVEDLGKELLRLRHGGKAANQLIGYLDVTRYGVNEVMAGRYKVTPYGSIGEEPIEDGSKCKGRRGGSRCKGRRG